jgi:hypothetical protein
LFGVVEATSGLSKYLTAEAIKTNSEWPFMTLSKFEVVSHTRAQASSELIVMVLIVNKENLEAWADYSTSNQGWLDESFDVLGEGIREKISTRFLPRYIAFDGSRDEPC